MGTVVLSLNCRTCGHQLREWSIARRPLPLIVLPGGRAVGRIESGPDLPVPLDLPAPGITTFKIASDHWVCQCADHQRGHSMNEHRTAGHEPGELSHDQGRSGAGSSPATDPVCGMKVDPTTS